LAIARWAGFWASTKTRRNAFNISLEPAAFNVSHQIKGWQFRKRPIGMRPMLSLGVV